jgi:hypothetical protein
MLFIVSPSLVVSLLLERMKLMFFCRYLRRQALRRARSLVIPDRRRYDAIWDSVAAGQVIMNLPHTKSQHALKSHFKKFKLS